MSGSQIGVDTSRTASSLTDGKGFAVGDRHTDHEGNEWLFVKASAAVAQFNAVWVKSTGNAANITDALARSGGHFGVASVAFAADEYGWVQTKGSCTVAVLASAAADTQLFTSGTAGFLDDATLSTSQVQVQGIILTSAEAASQAPAVMSNVVIRRIEV